MKTKNFYGKKVLSLTLTLIMVLSLIPLSSLQCFASEIKTAVETTNRIYCTSNSSNIDYGNYSSYLDDNDGDSYYEINSVSDLYAFSYLVNEQGYYNINAELTANIAVNGYTLDSDNPYNRKWIPIGYNNHYSGNFNGNNKTISGLFINDSTKDYVGLFGYVYDEGEITNLGITNSYFNGANQVGAVAGYVNYGRIENCYSEAHVKGESYVGGIAGKVNHGSVYKSYNTGNVSGYSAVGGVVGGLNSGRVLNNYNTGNVTGTLSTGGIASFGSFQTLANCYNTGNITSTEGYAGGILAINQLGSTRNCFNIGNITGAMKSGGIFATNEEGSIYDCYYLNTACDGENIANSSVPKTIEEFESGEVAYLLGENFGQKLGTQKHPVLEGDFVYLILKDGYTKEATYSNTPLYGDVDLDGLLTIRDATMISKYLVGREELYEDSIKFADANNDGNIDIIDVTHIQKVIAEMIL